MKTVLIYQVEGYDRFDKQTQNFIGVNKMEVIAESEKEALTKAEKMMKANNYMVIGCFERLIEHQFNEEEKKVLLDYLSNIAFYFNTHTHGASTG